MSIVCGTDFSVHAAEAADAAAWLAKSLGAKLLLVHVFEAARYDSLPKVMQEHLKAMRENQLSEEKKRLIKIYPHIETKLLRGAPALELSKLVSKRAARLTVVSSLGQVAPSRWLIGSVAERVVQSVPTPTLVVRGNRGFQHWVWRKRPLKILASIDSSPESNVVLDWIKLLRDIGRCRIAVATFVSPPQKGWWQSAGNRRFSSRLPVKIQDAIVQELKKKCEIRFGKQDVVVHVAAASGPVDHQIIDLARRIRADLVVIGTRQRSGIVRFWLGSVSRGVLHHAPMSVACVPLIPQKKPISSK